MSRRNRYMKDKEAGKRIAVMMIAVASKPTLLIIVYYTISSSYV